MTTTDVRKKVIAVLAIVGALTVPLTACTVGGPQSAKEGVAERTLAAANDIADCAHVDAPMLDIPTASDTEPRMRIPQPPGWEPLTDLGDVKMTRFAMVHGDPAVYPRKVVAVALERVPEASNTDAQTILDDARSGLVEMFAQRGWSTELTTTAGTVCGLPAETVIYAGDPAPNADPTAMLWIVVETNGQTYLAMITQDLEPNDPAYQRRAEKILSGFQVLPPALSA
jgi:hypothetical protein